MLIGMTMVHAEADIIEYFVRANLRLLDHLVIIATPGEDGTQEILQELLREALPITIWKTNRNHYAQGEVLTDIANRLRDQWQPDCLFLLDADEILLCKDKPSLRAEIANIPERAYGLLPWTTFIPPKNQRSLKFDRWGWTRRMANETQQFWKVVLPKQAGHHDVYISNGSHDIVDPTGTMRAVYLPSPCIAHLPVRSVAQIRSKALGTLIAKAIAEGTKWFRSEAFQLNEILENLRSGQRLNARKIAAHYLERGRTKGAKMPRLKIDRRLPKVKLRHKQLIRTHADDIRVFFHAWSALYNTRNPTESILTDIDPKNSTGDGKIDATSTSDTDLHLKLRHCDWPPFEYAAARFKPCAVLDVGCGLGLVLRLFRDRGAVVHGIEGSQWSRHHAISREEFSSCNLASQDFKLSQNSDLSIFTEVAEHLPIEAALRVIGELTTHTRKAIIFSAAQINQPGISHTTLREPEFWIDEFARSGWNVDTSGTFAVRTLATLHWYRQNLLLLRRGIKTSMDELKALLERGRYTSGWPCHRVNETIIGWPGERWSFRISGAPEVPPLQIYRGSYEI
jgi:hypothetical protein